MSQVWKMYTVGSHGNQYDFQNNSAGNLYIIVNSHNELKDLNKNYLNSIYIYIAAEHILFNS